MKGGGLVTMLKLCKLEKEASVREREQGLEREEEHYNLTCLAAGYWGKWGMVNTLI